MKNILLLTLIMCLPAFGQEQGERPLSLQDCRRLALEYNEKIKTADNAVEKARLDRQIAFAQYLPKVDGSLTLVHTKNIDLLNQDRKSVV